MDIRKPELYRRPCEICGGPAYWVLEDDAAPVQVRCADCGPPEEMRIWKGGYCCESCNGAMEDFVRRLGPRHNRVIRSGDLLALARKLERDEVPHMNSYRNPDYKVPLEERVVESVTLVRSFQSPGTAGPKQRRS